MHMSQNLQDTLTIYIMKLRARQAELSAAPTTQDPSVIVAAEEELRRTEADPMLQIVLRA